MGAAVQDRVRQVSYHATRQRRHRRATTGGVFPPGQKKRGLIKGKKWLLMSRWKNLTGIQRGELNRLFQLNRRVFKAYMLKESLERLWNYRYRGAMLNYLTQWMDQLKWQRLAPFEKLANSSSSDRFNTFRTPEAVP